MKHVANDHALSAMQEIATCEKLFPPNFKFYFTLRATCKPQETHLNFSTTTSQQNAVFYGKCRVWPPQPSIEITKFCNKVEAWKEKKEVADPSKSQV